MAKKLSFPAFTFTYFAALTFGYVESTFVNLVALVVPLLLDFWTTTPIYLDTGQHDHSDDEEPEAVEVKEPDKRLVS